MPLILRCLIGSVPWPKETMLLSMSGSNPWGVTTACLLSTSESFATATRLTFDLTVTCRERRGEKWKQQACPPCLNWPYSIPQLKFSPLLRQRPAPCRPTVLQLPGTRRPPLPWRIGSPSKKNRAPNQGLNQKVCPRWNPGVSELLETFPLVQFVFRGKKPDLSRPGGLDLFSGCQGVAKSMIAHGAPWVLTFDWSMVCSGGSPWWRATWKTSMATT